MNERFCKLESLIGSYRLMYYTPNLINKDWHKELTISDEEYEKLEYEYLTLCRELNYPNYYVTKNINHPEWENITNMSVVGVDLKRPSTIRNLHKYSRSKQQFQKFVELNFK